MAVILVSCIWPACDPTNYRRGCCARCTLHQSSGAALATKAALVTDIDSICIPQLHHNSVCGWHTAERCRSTCTACNRPLDKNYSLKASVPVQLLPSGYTKLCQNVPKLFAANLCSANAASVGRHWHHQTLSRIYHGFLEFVHFANHSHYCSGILGGTEIPGNDP